jgi:hypothetical protein
MTREDLVKSIGELDDLITRLEGEGTPERADGFRRLRFHEERELRQAVEAQEENAPPEQAAPGR